MKIVQVVQHLAPGGIEAMVLELQRVYQDTDDVVIVSLEGQYRHSVKRWDALSYLNCELYFMNKKSGIAPGLLRDLVRLFRELKPDVVHTHHIGPLLYGGLAARLAGVASVIHTEHDAWHLQASRKRRHLEALTLKLVKPTLVADAEHVAGVLRSLFPRQPLNVILNGIDTQRFYPGSHIRSRITLGLPVNRVLIGCAARLVPGKGHHYLLEALEQLPENLHLALAGDGPLRCDLMALARQKGLISRVHFLGNIRNMPMFYRSIDLFCLASEAEGLPLSPLEAQACGVPVVITDTGGCREAICQDTGVLVPVRDSRALAEGILAAMKNFTRETCVSPRDYVLAHHDLTKVAHQYRALMKWNQPLQGWTANQPGKR